MDKRITMKLNASYKNACIGMKQHSDVGCGICKEAFLQSKAKVNASGEPAGVPPLVSSKVNLLQLQHNTVLSHRRGRETARALENQPEPDTVLNRMN